MRAEVTNSPGLPETERFSECRSLVLFFHSSGGKESTCNVGDLGLIPGLGRSPGEGKTTFITKYWLFICVVQYIIVAYLIPNTLYLTLSPPPLIHLT